VRWTGDRAGESALGPEPEAVREELGLPESRRLTAELHTLLIYGEGQFFLPHQDSEKDDTMVATLVVTLPSAHTGGELIVHHLGEQTTYRALPDRLSLVAFYADCRHEVRPVTSGYRITLTYNLLLHGDPAGHVPDRATIAEAARHLGDHFATRIAHRYRDATGEPPHRLAFLLDHEYTDVDEDFDEDDDEADGGGDDTRYELNELIDSSIRLTSWTDPSGTSGEDVSLHLTDTEVCTAAPSSALTPYSSDYEGYMGNYGNTLDRWYRRAAVVVWPRDHRFTNRAQASPRWATQELSALARTTGSDAARSAAALAPFWSSAVRGLERPAHLLATALPAALAVDDASTATMLLTPFRIEDLRPRHMAPLAELAARYGPGWAGAVLRAWYGAQPTWSSSLGLSRPQWLATLPALRAALQTCGDHGTATAVRLLDPAWDSLVQLIGPTTGPLTTTRRQHLATLAEPLAALIGTAETLQATELRDRIVEHCRRDGEALTDLVLAALRTTAAGTTPDGAFALLAADQATRLRTRLAQPAQNADDWSIQLPEGCACPLCTTLRTFLADRERRTFEWPLAKDRRRHVHSRIDQAELPVSHQTRHQGSPHKLVLTKTEALFRREEQQRTADQAALDRVLERCASARGDALEARRQQSERPFLRTGEPRTRLPGATGAGRVGRAPTGSISTSPAPECFAECSLEGSRGDLTALASPLHRDHRALHHSPGPRSVASGQRLARPRLQSLEQQEVGDAQVVDAAGAVAGGGVEGDDVLRVVVGDGLERCVLTAPGVLRGRDGRGDLHVDGLLLAAGHEIDLGRPDPADRDVVAAAAQLEPDDVLEHPRQPVVGVTEEGVHDPVVADVVLLVSGQQRPPAHVVARHPADDEGIGEGRQVVEHGLVAHSTTLGLHEVGHPAGGEGAADVVDREGGHTLEHVDVPHGVAGQDVAHEGRTVDVRHHRPGVGFVQRHDVHAREPSVTQETRELRIRAVVEGPDVCSVELQELAEGQRPHLDGDITARDVGGQLSRQQPRVGAGDVDVGAAPRKERVDQTLPLGNLLDLVEEHVDAPVGGKHTHEMGVQRLGRGEWRPLERVEVQMHDALGGHPTLAQPADHELQQARLARAAQPSEHLDDRSIDEWLDAGHVERAVDEVHRHLHGGDYNRHRSRRSPSWRL